jgi:hypothetical protein
MLAAASISVSASANGSPSLLASRLPIELLPAPIMPIRTSDRDPSASTRAFAIASGPRPWH